MTAGPHRLPPLVRKSPVATKALGSDESGSVVIEYGLIAALVVVLLIVALVQLRSSMIDLPLPTLIEAFDEALS